MLRVVTLSTLFPNDLVPSFGVFVAGQTLRLAARSGVELRVVNPIGEPPFPLNRHPRYSGRRALPTEEFWPGVATSRPRFAMLPGISATLNPIAIARAVAPVLRRMRASGFDFDVIDAEFFYPDGPAAARLARSFGVPFSIKARGADIHYWGARRATRQLMLDAAAQAGGLLAVAGSLKRDMAALGIDPGKITVHYTGVDLERFRPLERSVAKAALGIDGPLVVSLGALIPRKGHDIVIEAVGSLPHVSLLIVGAGPEREPLERLIAARGLGQRVRLMGSLPHDRLPAILAAADVMALASASEGLANAWVEAMACGTPVVTPEVDGAAEAIDTKSSGRLVRERTAPSIAAAIASILDDPPSQDAVRAGAQRFTWERNTATLFDHLNGLVAASREGVRTAAPEFDMTS